MGAGDATKLLSQLIAFDSVCPDASGAQELIASRLGESGFSVQKFSIGGANHLWARYGNTEPLFVFSGHTDVVPPGPLSDWQSHPFTAEIRDGNIYGRGACDMKGGLAAMIVAAERYIKSSGGNPPFSIGFLIVGDEEGESLGTPALLSALKDSGIKISDCIVGEPTSSNTLGDFIKIGRRGSINGRIIFKGTQGHVGYPHLAKNAIHAALYALKRLAFHEWDRGNKFFDPTTFQITTAEGGVAENIVPGEFSVGMNWRSSSELSADSIGRVVHEILSESLREFPGVTYDLSLQSSAEPFLTQPGPLSEALSRAIQSVMNLKPNYSTAGGTSDARFFPAFGVRVIEFGLINATIHKANENAPVSDLENLSRIFERFLGEYAQSLK